MEHLQDGAFPVRFAEPDAPLDMFGREITPELRPPRLLQGKELQSAVDKYRTMERKGFLVTTDTGCLIPHEQYSTYQQGATVKGHQRSFAFFAHWVPTSAGSETVRNEFGWPATIQISHLCHRRGCCRIDHLIAEEQWRNQKRNYCGLNGVCDCGNDIKCLRRYQDENQVEEREFCTTIDQVIESLEGAPEYKVDLPVTLKERSDASAKRAASKAKRKRVQEKHAYATARNAAKRAGAGGERGDSEEDDFE